MQLAAVILISFCMPVYNQLCFWSIVVVWCRQSFRRRRSREFCKDDKPTFRRFYYWCRLDIDSKALHFSKALLSVIFEANMYALSVRRRTDLEQTSSAFVPCGSRFFNSSSVLRLTRSASSHPLEAAIRTMRSIFTLALCSWHRQTLITKKNQMHLHERRSIT